MYSLDVNFLKDREIRPVAAARGARPAAPVGDRRPLLFGLVGALVILALLAGYWLVLKRQVAQLAERNAELDAELADIQRKLAELSGVQAQIDAIQAENGAFINVFNQIVPWSALLQDIRDRTPTRIQLESIEQTAGETPANEPDATPPIAGGIEITGIGCSFDDINDFALVLQGSPLLEANTVNITDATKQSELLDPNTEGTCPGTPAGQPEFLVDYTIQANITNTPSSELIEELERRGAVGLVARLRALRETGALDDAPPEPTEADDEATQNQE